MHIFESHRIFRNPSIPVNLYTEIQVFLEIGGVNGTGASRMETRYPIMRNLAQGGQAALFLATHKSYSA